MSQRMKWRIALVLLLATFAFAVSGCTQTPANQGNQNGGNNSGGNGGAASIDYPTKNIDVVVPTDAGGAMDRAVQAFTNVWREKLGVNFQSSFYPGASGEVGYLYFMKAPSDGHTLLAGNIGPEMMMYGLQKPNYSFPDDYVYFATMDADPVVIWVAKDSPYQTIEDLIEASKTRPITIATSRYPHPATLAALILAEETGANFNIVAYGGGSATRTAGLTQEVDAVTSHLSSSLDLGSELRFLIMFNEENYWPELSDNAPTPKEAFGLDIPSLGANRAWGVKRDFIEQYPERYELLLSTFKEAMDDPRLLDEFSKVGMDPSFLQYLDEEESTKLANDMVKLVEEYGYMFEGK